MLILLWVQRGVFLVFHTDFRSWVVARIYTFPVNIVLTEFSKQLITRSIEVTRKVFSSVFLGKQSDNFQSCFFFANFNGFSGGNFNVFELFGKGQDCLFKQNFSCKTADFLDIPSSTIDDIFTGHFLPTFPWLQKSLSPSVYVRSVLQDRIRLSHSCP